MKMSEESILNRGKAIMKMDAEELYKESKRQLSRWKTLYKELDSERINLEKRISIADQTIKLREGSVVEFVELMLTIQGLLDIKPHRELTVLIEIERLVKEKIKKWVS